MIQKLIGALCLFLITLIGCSKYEQDIKISSSHIQKVIEKKFPYEKNILIAQISLDSPKVYFSESQIGIRVEYSGNFLASEIEGIVDCSGKVFYNQDDGTFYLSDFNIVEITVEDRNFSELGPLKDAVSKIMANYLNQYPLYQLKKVDYRENLAKMLLKRIRVDNDNLIVTLGLQ